MKKYVLMTLAVMMLAMPGVAWSAAPSPAGGSQGQDAQRFAQHKAQMLKNMNDHLAAVQKQISCIQAAQNRQALQACMPGGPPGGARAN
jgi:hypothetical protein